MSSSWNTEEDLRRQINELYSMAADLERAADILRDMRETNGLNERIKDLKQRASDWMKS